MSRCIEDSCCCNPPCDWFEDDDEALEACGDLEELLDYAMTPRHPNLHEAQNESGTV